MQISRFLKRVGGGREGRRGEIFKLSPLLFFCFFFLIDWFIFIWFVLIGRKFSLCFFFFCFGFWFRFWFGFFSFFFFCIWLMVFHLNLVLVFSDSVMEDQKRNPISHRGEIENWNSWPKSSTILHPFSIIWRQFPLNYWLCFFLTNCWLIFGQFLVDIWSIFR